MVESRKAHSAMGAIDAARSGTTRGKDQACHHAQRMEDNQWMNQRIKPRAGWKTHEPTIVLVLQKC